MSGILPVKKQCTTARAKFPAKLVRPPPTEQLACSIHDMLIRQGLGKTLEYLCTYSTFSVLSED